jgi:hypothetical protein
VVRSAVEVRLGRRLRHRRQKCPKLLGAVDGTGSEVEHADTKHHSVRYLADADGMRGKDEDHRSGHHLQ